MLLTMLSISVLLRPLLTHIRLAVTLNFAQIQVQFISLLTLYFNAFVAVDTFKQDEVVKINRFL